ncbi:carbohydrate ABC transporter permease [Arthrobacter sp. UYCu723]
MIPVLVVFATLTALPLAISTFWSFTDYDGVSADFAFVRLDNYKVVFSDPSLMSALTFTLMFAIATTLIITVLAILLAVVLNKSFFGRDLARSVFFFLGVPSLAILGLVWRFILSPLDNGVANQFLINLGLEGLPWLADENLARWSVILIAVWAGVGWHATLYLAYMQSIPGDLYEQSTMDGANPLQQFVSITLPYLVPAIAVSTFLLVTGGLKIYDLPFTLTSGGPGYATSTITQAIIQRGVRQSEYGIGSALATVFTLATLLVVAAQFGALRAITRRFS